MFGLKTVALKKKWNLELGDHIISLISSPDGQFLATAIVSGQIFILSKKDGTIFRSFSGHQFGTTSVSWLDSNTIVSAGQDGKIKIWNICDNVLLAELLGGNNWVECISVSYCRSFFASSSGKILRIWNKAGTLLQTFSDHTSTISDLAWKPNCTDLASSCYGGVGVFNPAKSNKIKAFDWKGSVLKLCWSPDGKYLATGDQDSTVHFWIYASGRDLQMWGYSAKVRELSWNANSRYLATGGSCTVTVWDCSGKGPEGTKPISLEAHDQSALISALSYQNKGNYLLSGGQDGLIALWQPEKTKQSISEFLLKSEITQLSWSSDGKSFFAGTDVGEVVLYSI